jgi:hypothetical protein
MSKCLPIPSPARSDPHALEMIRVWIAKGEVHTSLRIGFWEGRDINEADAWGMLLADAVRHMANAHEEEHGRDPRETIASIREAFERQLAKPATQIRGSFVGKRRLT